MNMDMHIFLRKQQQRIHKQMRLATVNLVVFEQCGEHVRAVEVQCLDQRRPRVFFTMPLRTIISHRCHTTDTYTCMYTYLPTQHSPDL